MNHWRSMRGNDKANFLSWAGAALTRRWEIGDKRYNSSLDGFQGNPTDHAIEEALDLLLYLWIQKRKEMEQS